MSKFNLARLKELFMMLRATIVVAVIAFLGSFGLTISGQTKSEQLFSFSEATTRVVLGLPENEKASPAAVREREISLQVTAKDLEQAKQISFSLLDELSREAMRDETEGLEVRGENDITWRGQIIGEPESSITLTLTDGVVSGLIFAASGVYEIIPLTDGKHALVEINQDLYPLCGGEIRTEDAEQQKEAETGDGPVVLADTGNRIDVLVVYTDDARRAAGGTANIRSTIQQAIAATNTAYSRSRIAQRVRLVHTAEVAYNEGGNASNDLSWLRNNASIQRLRNRYKADLVNLFVNRSDACGIGYIMTNVNTGFAPYGYSVVARGCAVGNLSFAHELGHNMGAAHNPENAGSGAYSYSFGHYVNGVFRTVMSYVNPCSSGCTRVPYFSNPNVTYNGYRTGIANRRDNARTLNNTDRTVANFRSGGN